MSKIKNCIKLIIDKDKISILRNEIKIIDDIPADKLDDVLADLEKMAKDAGKTLDDYLDWLAKNSGIGKFLTKYGKNIKYGDDIFLQTFKAQLKGLNINGKIVKFKKRAQRMFNSKKRTISFVEYERWVTIIIRNKEKGALAERLFLNIFKGIKPSRGEKTLLTWRYIDNILQGIARELKSGKVILGNKGKPEKGLQCFETQFAKDCEIIFRKEYDLYEWHCLNGIDEKALKWALEYAEKMKILDKIKFVIY
jgi:hypothetical protein